MKTLIKKILLFSLIIFALQTAISSFEWGVIVFKEFEDLKKYLAEKIDAIFFGDSSVYTHDPRNDTDKRTIAQMLQAELDETSVMPVVHPAYHMGLYLEFCKYIAEQKEKPKAVVVPVNIRSFSPEWDLQPMYQFSEEKSIINSSLMNTFLLNVFNRPLKVFKYAYDADVISMMRFAKAPIYYKDSVVGNITEYTSRLEIQTDSSKKKTFLMRYMFYINKNHRKMRELAEIARLMRKSGVIPLYYIIPIDYETGEHYFPGDFIEITKRNAALLKSESEKAGAAVIDLSLRLKANQFDYDYYPNEHMRQSGRLLVAGELAKKMKELGLR